MASRSRSSRSRHSSSSDAGSARISEDQLLDLLSKLQHLIPEARSRRSSGSNRASASNVLQETCNYIKSLHREVDDLSERLADLLASMDVDNAQAAIIRSLLM
ncbi:unnamed protein product [Rhodiola kirilowii]